jgi:hypothetical protein
MGKIESITEVPNINSNAFYSSFEDLQACATLEKAASKPDLDREVYKFLSGLFSFLQHYYKMLVVYVYSVVHPGNVS